MKFYDFRMDCEKKHLHGCFKQTPSNWVDKFCVKDHSPQTNTKIFPKLLRDDPIESR